MSSVVRQLDEDLARRLPLPLAHLYRRAHNARTPLERHHAAFYLAEAAIKLLGSTAITEYVALNKLDSEIAVLLENLARPTLGHWWQIVQRLTAVLAQGRDAGFVSVEQFLLGGTRDDLPRAAGLDAALRELLEGGRGPRSTVQISKLVDRLVRYRNQELGHGAAGQRSGAFYEHMAQALLAGIPEMLVKIDVLAGRRLVHISDVRRQTDGRWLLERYELIGESPRRLESLILPADAAGRLPNPDRVYLQCGGDDAMTMPMLRSLHPLVVLDANSGEVFFLNARRGSRNIEYLCYSTGQVIKRDELGGEHRELLKRVLGSQVDSRSVDQWTARSESEEFAPPSEEPPSKGKVLGDFELLTEIGRGGMGVVYRAWQPSLGRQVALKCLLRSGDPKAETRFAREIRALGRVEHPHLIKIFTSGAEGDQWFFAMELLDGASLAAVLEQLQSSARLPNALNQDDWKAAVAQACDGARRSERPISGPLPNLTYTASSTRTGLAWRGYVRHVAELVRQVAEAAHALHEAGIVHRDIKPGNIIATPDGDEAVLMDLGLAQLADDVQGKLTRTRQFVGTLRYASPEQVLAAGGLDRRSDVYSLGATLWEMLTLRPIYGAGEEMSSLELMRRIEYAQPEQVRKYHADVPRDLEAIVARCLEKDPARRYSSALDLAADLRRFLDGEMVQARPVSGPELMWRAMKRRPLETALVVACVVSVLAVAATFVTQRIRAREREYARQLERSNQEVERQRQQAETNFRQALSAVDDVFTLVSSGELSNRPDLQPLRNKLLEYYRHYAEQRKDDPGLQSELADVYRRMAKITTSIDRKQDALQYYQRAYKAQLQLLHGSPDESEYRDQLAVTQIDRAILLTELRDHATAEAELKSACQILEQLIQEPSSPAGYRRHLAEAYHNLGILYDAMNARADSLKYYEQGLNIRQRLVEEGSQRQDRRDLARSYGYLGDVQLELGETESALAAYQQAELIRRQLVDEDPSDHESRFQLARSFRNTGYFYDRLNDAQRAIEQYQQARNYSEQLVRERPAVTQYRTDLVDYCNAIAELLTDQGQIAAADEPLRRATNLSEQLVDANPGDVMIQSQLAESKVTRARLEAADNPAAALEVLKAAQTILEQNQDAWSVTDLYSMAVIEALRGKLLEEHSKELTDEDRQLLDRHRTEAIDYARRAVAAGFRNAARLERDPAFKSLVEGTDFRELIERLKQGEPQQERDP